MAKFLRPRLVRTACVAAVRLRLESTEVGQALERVNNQATSELEFGCSTFAFQGFVTLFLSRRAQLHKDDYFSARGRRSHITESFLRSLGSHGEERSNLLANYLIVTEQLAQMPGWPSEVDEHLKGELRILRTFISKLEQADRQALEIRKNHLEYNLQAFEGAASLEII